MHISNDIRYIGVNDHQIDLFEGQYIVPNGMAYNSYVIMDEKIAVLDTVDQHFGADWFANLEKELDGRQPDYLVVHHMEPDHSANIGNFIAKYPNTKIVASLPAFNMMKNYYETDFPAQKMVVKEGSTLELGKHTLTFIGAAMVHWPEVLMSYESTEKVLFTADAFGKFGALDVEEDWACEARRYYIGIVGKFGAQVQTVLKKAAALDIQTICPLHGPVLTENLGYYINLYNIWSGYAVESEGVMIAYTSVYGNTKKAVEYLAEELKAKGCAKVVVCDLAREDMAEAVEDAFRYGKLVLATTTYNGDIFPFMRTFIDHLTERNFQNRKVALVENGSWAPVAAKMMANLGLNPADVVGSGKGGRITKEDVRNTHPQPAAKPVQVQSPAPQSIVSAQPSSLREEKRVPMSRLRARVAERLVKSQSDAAILTTFNEVNLGPVMALRAKYKESFEKKYGIKLGFMSFFVKAAVYALQQYPIINASVEGSDIIYHNYIDIGVAVGSPRGLVVPVLRDADQLSFAQIERQIADFAKRAASGKLELSELTGGTFTISNGGVFGSLFSTPIINPPQSAILGIHATKQRPVVENGEIVIRPMNYFALSYDHRIIDGREAVLALVAMKDALEDPARLLLDI